MFFNNKFNTFFGLNLTLVYTFPMCMTWRFHFPLRNYDFKTNAYPLDTHFTRCLWPTFTMNIDCRRVFLSRQRTILPVQRWTRSHSQPDLRMCCSYILMTPTCVVFYAILMLSVFGFHTVLQFQCSRTIELNKNLFNIISMIDTQSVQ